MQWSEKDNLEALKSLKAQDTSGRGARRIERQYSRSKLTARDRIELLPDEGSCEEFDLLMTGRGSGSRVESTHLALRGCGKLEEVQ